MVLGVIVSADDVGLTLLSDVAKMLHQTVHDSTFCLSYVDFAASAAFDPVYEVGTPARDVGSGAVPPIGG